jgi:hypothetical protein
MADKTPIRGAYSGSSLTGLAEYATGDTIGISFGGTGLATVGSNQLLTGNGTSALTSESNLTFDGTILKATGDLCATVKVVSPALCIGSEYALPTADGSAGQIMCTNGSGALAFATASAGVTLAGSTNNTIATVTGSDALAGEANLTFTGTTLTVDIGASNDDNLILNADAAWNPKLTYTEAGVVKAGVEYDAGACKMRIQTGGTTNAIVIDCNQNVGIATASPAYLMEVKGAGGNYDFVANFHNTNATDGAGIKIQTVGTGTSPALAVYGNDGSTAALRVQNNGKVGIGTTAPGGKLSIYDPTSADYTALRIYQGGDSNYYWDFTADVDAGDLIIGGNHSSFDLILNPTQGQVGIGTTSPGGVLTATETGTGGLHLFMLQKTNASAAGNFSYWDTTRTSSTGFNYGSWTSGTGPSSKQEFLLTGDGNGKADGTWQDNQYDYAEYFESATGVTSELGRSVVLDDGKMRYYDASTDDATNIIGITRPKKNAKGPSIHNVAWNGWHERYVTDDFGQYEMEDVTVWSWDKIEAVEANESEGVEAVEGREEGGVYERDELAKDPDWTPPADATSSTQSVRKQNPDYDPALADDYKSREDRDEWWLIGLLGQVQIKANEPTNPRWIKMRQISDAVDMWMIR